MRAPITYKGLAHLVGIEGPGVLGKKPLDRIANYCIQNNLLLLTSVVVNGKTGLPGNEIPIKKSATQREVVFDHPWFKMVAPTPDQLHEAHLNAK